METVVTRANGGEIHLKLTPAEFGILEWLRWHNLNGRSREYQGIMDGFNRIVNELPALDQERIRNVRDLGRQVTSDAVVDLWPEETVGDPVPQPSTPETDSLLEQARQSIRFTEESLRAVTYPMTRGLTLVAADELDDEDELPAFDGG
jgi:hypothetical protein